MTFQPALNTHSTRLPSGSSTTLSKYPSPDVRGSPLMVYPALRSFSVSLIPHTGACTTLLSKRPGDPVNLETDVIGKYVEKLMQPTTPPLTASMLQQYGF